ncbi:uncharacterized protein TrAtP1_005794 [Trichoderma atroviride]|uniref:uncharacterized protein n=1 Tax=Hypocrea atroviridis TaxID=63577 RepID=UPI0033170421|nr:hypothetical protein TrAtP1_005794 [Trichoderma atroviride]
MLFTHSLTHSRLFLAPRSAATTASASLYNDQSHIHLVTRKLNCPSPSPSLLAHYQPHTTTSTKKKKKKRSPAAAHLCIDRIRHTPQNIHTSVRYPCISGVSDFLLGHDSYTYFWAVPV